MIFYIIKWTILYLILIFLLHNLYLFFEKNLTTTKIKDFYNFPTNEYNKINLILNNNNNNLIQSENLFNNNINNNEIEMKSELQDFLNKIK